MWKALRKGPEGWERLVRGFEKKYLRPWLRPERTDPEADRPAPAKALHDRRGPVRRSLSALKASANRQAKRARKGLWTGLKAVVALMPLPLEEARENAARANLVGLDRKLYRPDTRDMKRRLRVTKRTMSRLHTSRLPVIAGPWLSEIGFELLYWIPFLYWARANAQLHPGKLWVVSRGGTNLWYRHLTSNYIDLFDFMTPDEFRAGNLLRIEEQGGLKHKQISGFDREIIDRVEQQIPGSYARVLHPSSMYKLFQPYFLKNASVRLVEAFSYYRKVFDETPVEPLPGLPDDYVAVKFYGNSALPETPANRAFIRGLVSHLAEDTHIVSLDTGVQFDDHSDLVPLWADRYHSIAELMTPQNNLDVQTRVIQGARRLYCTYGGFSYLGPLCGTSTVTVYSEPAGFKVEHLELAQRVFERLDTPPFAVFDLSQLGAIREDLDVLRQVIR